MALREKYLLVSLKTNEVIDESFDLDYIKDRKEALSSIIFKHMILIVATIEK